MKVLIVSPSQGKYGGIEAFVIALASSVASWPGFEVQVCFKLVADFELKDELKVAAAVIGCPFHYVRSGEYELVRLIGWADIVHGQNTSPDIIFPAWLRRKRVVLTIHNWRQGKPGARYYLWGIGARLAQRRWYNSKFVWGTWEPRGKRKGSDCIPTVCNFPTASCPIARRKGFVFMGRWIDNKGIDDLVVAYSRAELDPAQWPLILMGDGPLKAKVQSLISELNVQGVEMPGFVTDEVKAHKLASARWLVAPAKTREDLGLTPIEARSVGVPVIVTRDGGLPEAGGEAALIVEPGNIEELTGALKRAAGMDESEYLDRAKRGRDSLKTFLRPMEFYRDSYVAVMNGN